MKRLTNPDIDYSQIGVVENMRTATIAAMLCRLVAYENTGKMPKDISDAGVSKGVFEQVIWERDIALSQLADIGKGLGAKMDDVVEAINGKSFESR